MAVKGGHAVNGRDSQSKRLGIKRFGGQYVSAGSIIVRQRGTKVHPGKCVGRGSDDTLFALKSGLIAFDRNGKRVNVVEPTPKEQPATA